DRLVLGLALADRRHRGLPAAVDARADARTSPRPRARAGGPVEPPALASTSERRRARNRCDRARALRLPVGVQGALPLGAVDERADVRDEGPQSGEATDRRVLVSLRVVHAADVLGQLEVAEDDEAGQQTDEAVHSLAAVGPDLAVALVDPVEPVDPERDECH